MPRPQPRLAGALSLSAAAHASAALLFVFIIAGGRTVNEEPQPRETVAPAMIWLPRAGAEGGRRPAGDGNQRARPVLRAGEDRISVPASPPPSVEAAPVAPEPPRIEPIAIAAEPSASALQDLLGALVSISITGATGQGSAGRPGADGAGPGLGLGDGHRPGVGAGSEGVGSGLVPPRLLSQVKPSYTADAMRARIQGIVALEAVVLADGTVGDVRVVRTLDSTFGLDREALKAVKQWRFVPGTRSGRPAPFIISAELTFTLR